MKSYEEIVNTHIYGSECSASLRIQVNQKKQEKNNPFLLATGHKL